MIKRHKFILYSTAALGLAAFVLSGCKVGYPFSGPGYEPALGVTHPAADNRVLVAVTTGQITRGSGAAFAEQLREVMDSLPGEPGLIGFAVRRQLVGNRVWTMSVWTDEAALARFLAGPAHREAVRVGGIPAESVSSTTYWLPVEQVPPSWAEAVGQLE